MEFTKQKRQEIAEEFCHRHGGSFDAGKFLSEAKAKRHPAHDWFTWDDGVAAHKQRLAEARNFVRDLRVEFDVETIDRGQVRVSVPAFISPVRTREDGGGYVRADTRAGIALLCEEAAKSLREWQARYEGAVAHAGGTLKHLEALAQKLDKAAVA